MKNKKIWWTIAGICAILAVVVTITCVALKNSKKAAVEGTAPSSSGREWTENLEEPGTTTINGERELPGLTVRGEPMK